MENYNISCNIIRDLLPSYIDELTSEETNCLIEKHISECEECKNIYDIMKEPQKNEVDMQREIVELDFLKKSHRRIKLIIGFVVLAASIITIIGIRMSSYLEKREFAYDQYDLDFSVGDITVDNVFVEDGFVQMDFRPYGKLAIKDVKFEENDGIVTFTVIGSNKGFNGYYEYETAFHMDKPIKQIKTGDTVLWDNGVFITESTIDVYKTKHLYVGDHIKNGSTLRALKINDTLGEYKMELQTKSEPYGMILNLQKEVAAKQQKYFESCMKYYAYASMAVIDNLSYVSFSYSVDVKTVVSTWSVEDANTELEKSIKEYGKSETNFEFLKMDLNIIK